MQYKILILIAVYKARQYVESKIASLVQQTIFNQCKILFLNCQNLENENEEIEKAAAQYANIEIVNFSEYVKLYDSWNIGISQNLNIPYCTNYNMDDQWNPTYLEKAIQHLEETDADIVSSGVLVTDTINQVWPNWSPTGRMPLATYPASTAGPSPVWRMALHEKYGLFGSYLTIGDARIWETWYANGVKFGLISEDLVLYYRNPESLERRRDSSGVLLRDVDLRS